MSPSLVRLCLPLLALLAACRQDMHDQPKFEPFEATSFFPDGRASRPQVAGTVARGQLRLDRHLYEGRIGGELATTLPVELGPELLARGEERYAIFCAPCHGMAGYGEGMVVKRGLKRPASFHEARLREAPVGYFFDVITNGFGAMYDYSDRIPAEDRWAIAAWIRVLQRSQNATLEDVPEPERARLRAEAGL